MAAKLTVKNPFLQAITYHYCFNLPDETIRSLPIKYRRMLASKNKTRTFCEKATMDERIVFFYYIGLNFGITIFPDKAKSTVALKEIIRKYEDQKLAAAQNQQAAIGCYVSTDKEIAFIMGCMGHSINSESYIRALDFNKLGYSLREWDKKLTSPDQLEMEEVVNNNKIVANTLLNTGLVFGQSTALFGLNETELKILFYMFIRRHAYIKRTQIKEELVGYITQIRLDRAIKKLLLNDYLKKHFDWQTYQCTITTQGINVVTEFINRIVKANTF